MRHPRLVVPGYLFQVLLVADHISIRFHHPLNHWPTIDCATGKHAKVRQHLCLARAVGMPAKHRHTLTRGCGHRFKQGIPNRLASELRQPVIVGDSSLVPARRAKRRDMRQDNDVPNPSQWPPAALCESAADSSPRASSLDRRFASGVFVLQHRQPINVSCKSARWRTSAPHLGQRSPMVGPAGIAAS